MEFSKAFALYFNNSKQDKDTIISLIESIKAGMNSKRKDFSLPASHEFNISGEWLLGFVEGDGSFYYDYSKNTLAFSISQKGNKELLDAIKAFFVALQPSSNPLNKSNDIDWVNIYHSNGMNTLSVRQIDYIQGILIPLFDGYSWHSKKHQDYIDWKAIFAILSKGLHYLPAGEAMIKRIIGQMNNNRLSTNEISNNSQDNLLLRVEVAKLLEQPSNYQISEDGRLFIVSLNRYKVNNKAKTVQLVEVSSGDTIATFNSVNSCAKYLGVALSTVQRRILVSSHFIFEGKTVFVRIVES